MKLASDKSDSFNQNTVLKQVGSFWLGYLKDRSQARTLVAACNKIKLFNYFENAFNQLISQSKIYLNDFFAVYSFEKVFFTQDSEYGADSIIYFSNDELLNLVEHLEQYGESPAVYNQGSTGIGFYIINKKDLSLQNIEDAGLTNKNFEFNIISIQSPKKGKLIVHNDFFETKDFILFVDNPDDLFEDEKILISRASVALPTIYRYPLRIGEKKKIETNKYFSLFSRFYQSLDKFKLALASYCGIGILDETSELLEKTSDGNLVTYVFDRQILKINYEHQELEVGKIYEKDSLVGEGLEVHYNQGQEGWWRAVDWKNGLSLSVVSDRNTDINETSKLTANLKLPNESFPVENNGISPTGKEHIRIHLNGDIEKQDAYWEFVKEQEVLTNTYLSNSTEEEFENPLDLFFKFILKDFNFKSGLIFLSHSS